MKYGSVCSGIESATVAWHSLGWTPSWFAEIEPFPCSVLAHHYPDVPNLGDMTKIKKSILHGRVEAPDVLVGGTPCQAFSVAGLRNGLDDQRGQLTLEFVRLANAIDFIRAKRKQQPSIIVWENVPGVLSSKDNAFGCFLAGLVGESSELQPAGNKWTNAGCVFGPERAVAWRVLDAQYFGLAQRRRRVFVVASARKDINCTKILFEFDSVRRDIAPSREPKQNVAATIEASLGRSRGAGTPIGGLWWTGADVADTLTCSSNNQRMPDKNKIQAVITLACRQLSLGVNTNLASPLMATDYKEPQVVCVHGTQDPCTTENVAHTLGCNNGQENALVYPINTMTCQGRPSDDLNPRMGLGIGQETDPCPTLTKAHSHAVAYAFDSLSSNSMKSSNPHSGCRKTEIAKTLDTTVPCPSKNQGGIGVLQNNSEIAYGIPGNWIGRKPENGGNATEPPLELSPCLTVADVHAVSSLMQVRRLTPKECERLQGFPDDYTLVQHNKKIATDSPRYKALGNSMAVPVMHWIGQRIQQHLKKEVAA
ncbi:MAG TPA: DNA cytosine methyltransferase [Agitococcus sp.]|nr:DNA cytosine methyltransferase [Agitococcus sp.]